MRAIKEATRDRRQKTLEESQNKLDNLQQLLKEQIDLNDDLKDKVSKILLKDVEQVQLIEESTEQIKAMQEKIIQTEETARQQDGQKKYVSALMELSKYSDLNQLTLLAVQIQ